MSGPEGEPHESSGSRRLRSTASPSQAIARDLDLEPCLAFHVNGRFRFAGGSPTHVSRETCDADQLGCSGMQSNTPAVSRLDRRRDRCPVPFWRAEWRPARGCHPGARPSPRHRRTPTPGTVQRRARPVTNRAVGPPTQRAAEVDRADRPGISEPAPGNHDAHLSRFGAVIHISTVHLSTDPPPGSCGSWGREGLLHGVPRRRRRAAVGPSSRGSTRG